MADQNSHSSHSEHHHHHHHHHRKDSATIFKERSLRAIVLQRKAEKWLKIILMVVAAIMVLAVAVVYCIG
jgi:type IV secretory pathway component VirB8